MVESRTEILDVEEVEQTSEGNTGYQDEWTRLRSAERGLLPEGSRDIPPDDEADTSQDKPDGQDRGESEGSPGEEAADPQDPAATEAADIWADAPPALREAYEAERIARERAENLGRTQSGRAAQAQRRLNELEQKYAGLRSSDAEAPKGEDGKSREERLADLREEYPQLAGPILEEMDQLRQTVSTIAGEAARNRDEAYFAEQERALGETHPDWSTVTASPEWAQWANEQPPHIWQGLVRNGNGIVDAVEAADLISRFKAATGKTPADQDKRSEAQERRQRQLDAGRTGSVRTPATPARGSDDSFAAAWAAEREKEQREAAAKRGR